MRKSITVRYSLRKMPRLWISKLKSSQPLKRLFENEGITEMNEVERRETDTRQAGEVFMMILMKMANGICE